jgi:hypothetical protein
VRGALAPRTDAPQRAAPQQPRTHAQRRTKPRLLLPASADGHVGW